MISVKNNLGGSGGENLLTELDSQESLIDQIETAIEGRYSYVDEELTVTPTAEGLTVTPSSEDNLISKVTINGDEDLIASNIKSGVNIFGVDGSIPLSSVTATASDVINSKKFVDSSGILQTGVGVKDGSYAWKKSSIENYIKETTTTSTTAKNFIYPYSSSNVLYYSTSYSFDETTGKYTLINPTTVSGSTLSDAVQLYSGQYFMLNNDGQMYRAAYKYGSENYATTIFNNSVNGFGIQTYGNYQREAYTIYGASSATRYTFLNYIASNNSSEYPDIGTQDGYYWEKVGAIPVDPSMFGCTKIAIDTKTWSSASGSISYSHSLGEVPKVAILTCAKTATSSSGSGVYVDICTDTYFVHNRLVNGVISSGNASNGVEFTSSTVYHSSINGNTFAGIVYSIYTMA